MADSSQNAPAPTVLLASARNSTIASRMAIRFAQAGCRVAAVYPSKSHPLAVTQAVTSRHHYSVISPRDSLVSAMQSCGSAAVVPCDALVVRHLHALHAALPATPEGAQLSRTIERSLGDPTAYLLLDSRHEVQIAAHAEGLPAAESFAIGRTTDPAALAQTLPFPWMLRADYASDGRDSRLAGNLAEARRFIRRAGSPPGLPSMLRSLTVNLDRAALEEWLHAMRPSISAQRPVTGTPAIALSACYAGETLALMQAEVLLPFDSGAPPAKLRLIEDSGIEQTVRTLTGRLGLSGFHEFSFIAEPSSGEAWLTGVNSHCALPAHLNAGPGRDLVGAWCRRVLGVVPAQEAPVHPGPVIANFPAARIADPNDPILSTAAYDTPSEEPQLMKWLDELARRSRQYRAFRSRLPDSFPAGGSSAQNRTRNDGKSTAQKSG